DLYLLCSDGLTDMVEADAVREIVTAKRGDLAEAAAELIDLANQNGGRDNISVIMMRVPAEFLPTSSWLQRWMGKKPAGAPAARAMSKLVLFLPDGTTRDIALRRERTAIGRRADNDICLPNLAVSGEHAVIVTILTDSFLEDLGSTNGTLVNGKPIGKHFLR